MNISRRLSSVRELPEQQRRIILWTVTGIVGVILFSWWMYNVKQQLPSLQESSKNDIPFSELKESLQGLSGENQTGAEMEAPQQTEQE